MAFERYKAYYPLLKSPSEQYQADFQALVDQQIDNAYNYYDIEVEDELGTQVFSPTKARVSYVINPGTGTKLSDDWKQLIFQNPKDGYAKMGKRFRYYDDTWLTINTEEHGSATSNCIIRRCNNTLNFLMPNDTVHKEPCAIDNELKYGNIYFNNSVNISQGTIVVWLQFNDYTKDIAVNDRFIIGYNQVFKVKSVINFLSDYTFTPDGAPIIKMEMQKDSILASDDFIRGITYSTKNDFIVLDRDIRVTPNIDSIMLNDTVTFNCYMYYNNERESTAFDFSIIDTGVPALYYEFRIIDGNTFTIKNNKKYLNSTLKINCVNKMNNEQSAVKEIRLGGVY